MHTAPRAPISSDFVTIGEVARSLGTSYATAYSLAVSARLGDATRIGNALLYERRTANLAIVARRAQLAARSRSALPRAGAV